MSVGNKTFLKHHFNDVCLPEYLYINVILKINSNLFSDTERILSKFWYTCDKKNVYRYDVIIWLKCHWCA